MFDQAVRASTAPLTLTLRVVCAPMPPRSYCGYLEVTLKLQQGTELVPGTPERVGGAEGLAFQCEVQVRPHRAFGEPEFFGACVSGSGGIRFLSLVWEGWDGAKRARFRRMKLSLAGISWDRIREASVCGAPLEVVVPGVDEDGALTFGNVRLGTGGWRLPTVHA